MADPNQTLDAFAAEYGFDPFRVHCLVTGKPIGNMFDEEMDSVLALVCESNDGADEAANDLWLRVLAAMRPSLKWNKFRSESLAQMRKTDPIETLAYLVNRMFAPHNRLKGGLTMPHLEERIKTWQQLESWGQTDETNTLTYMLLELDAKMGLDEEMPPFNWRDFFGAESMELRLSMVQAWYVTLMERWEKRLKAEELQTRWIRHGNVLAKPAFRDAFIESTPLSVTAIKRKDKAQEKAFFADIAFENPILRDLFGMESAEQKAEAVPTPYVVPLRKTPTRFGVKK